MANNNLTVIDGETLADMRLPPAQYCVKSLLHQGVTILGGAPKIGKSWLVLDLCVRVAKGKSVFGLEVRRGTTLYLCLEDTLRRIQHRLVSLTDEAPPNMFFSTEARTLTDGLCDQVREFVRAHPDTVLVAVDTFQVIRSTTPDVSYATDYQDVRELKKLADELGISILLVHHLRKQGAADPLNKLSGTTGIAGAVDAVLVLEKSDRCQSGAALICTGRDIEYRELELRFESVECSWELVSDSAEDPALLLPTELGDLVEFMRVERHFSGSNTELAERYNAHAGRDLTAKKLKQLMNKWRYELEAQGLVFESRRSNGQRFVDVSLSALGSDASLFSGLVYCMDCGAVMTYHRTHGGKEAKARFICSNYRKNSKTTCSVHGIREEDLYAIVLDDLRRVTHFARQNERKFAEYIGKKRTKESQKEMRSLEKQISAMTKRQSELMSLFKRLYEDNVLGRIPDEQYRILSAEYTSEQESIKTALPELTTHLQELKDSTSNFDRFLENAHKYTEINGLTPELLHTFIKRIEVGERAKKYSRSAPQDIVIHYRDIGILDDMPQELEDILIQVAELEIA